MTVNGNNMLVRSGFLPDRIVHLHPTRLCNLACLHCYSESGPKEKTSLGFEELQRALITLRAEGYAQISLSGGEPMVYPQLVPLIDYAHACGFRVTMITNGLFTNQKMDDVARRIDGIAISFDGLTGTWITASVNFNTSPLGSTPFQNGCANTWTSSPISSP